MASRFGLAATSLVDAERVDFFQRLGMVGWDASRLAVTPQGMPLLDALLGELVASELVLA
jgi:oxygen-independent coproporphyrinogen-3 oxidase